MSKNVVVTHIESVKSFYVFLEKHISLETSLQEFLKNSVASIEEQIECEKIYLVQQEEDIWYRVKVLKIIDEQFCEVRIVDYGNIRKIELENLRKCNNQLLCVMQPHAVLCSLDFDEDEINIHDEIIKLYFEFLVAHLDVLELVFKRKEDDKLVVDLISLHRVQNYSLTDFLISVSSGRSSISLQGLIKFLPEVSIDNDDLVRVCYAKSPSDFFITPVNSPNILQIMNDFYRNNPIKFSCFVRGSLYAYVDEDDSWHRAEMLSISSSSKTCQIQLVDTGEELSTSFCHLFELDQKFYETGRLAVSCCLANIEPITSEWTAPSLRFLNVVLHLKSPLEVNVFGTNDDGRLKVEFSVNYKELKININHSMVFFKLAKLQHGAEDKPNFESLRAIQEIREPKFEDIQKVRKIDFGSDPFDNQIRFSEFLRPVQLMETHLQRFPMYQPTLTVWNVGDKCLVKCWRMCETSNEHRKLWRRGLILKVEKKALIYLLDHDDKVQISLTKLKKCPQAFETLNTMNDVYRRFYTPKLAAIEDQQACYENNIQSEDQIQEIEEVSDILVESIVEEKRKTIKNPDKSTWTLLHFAEELGEEMSKEKERQKRIEARLEFVKGSVIEIGRYQVEMVKSSVKKWMDQVPLKESCFMAVATNVDLDGTINLYNYYERQDLGDLNNVINFFFKGNPEANDEFKVGDACLAQFRKDTRFYRATIVKTFDTDCLVRFIDYNNIERVSYSKLHSSIICLEVPPFAHKFRLIGQLPSPEDCENYKFTSTKFTSVLHDYIVDKPIYLKVHLDDIAITDPNYPKRCTIEVNKEVFKTYYEFLEFSKDFHINSDGSITSE